MRNQDIQLTADIVDLLLDAVCVVNREGCFLCVTGASREIFGYSAEEMVGKPMIDFVLPEDREMTLRAAAEIVAGNPKTLLRNRYVRKDGSIVHIMWSAQSSAEGTRVAIARDVTKLARAEALHAALYAISEAAHNSEDVPALLRCVHGIVSELLPAGRLHLAICHRDDDRVSLPCEELGTVDTLRSETEGLCIELIRAERAQLQSGARTDVAPVCAGTIARGGGFWLGVALRARNHVVGALLLRRAHAASDDAEPEKELLQRVSGPVATALVRKQQELRLRHMALYDSLTDLPNRDLLEDRLETAQSRARRNRHRVGVLFIDLDGFKEVNDKLGHETGDALLRQVAGRLRSCVRESDTLGRLGGDEFMAVLDGIDAPEHALLVAERIRAAIAEPFDVSQHRLAISSSIGVALCPDHGGDYQTLVRRADLAMYEAKARGKNLSS